MIKPEDVRVERVGATRWVVAYHPSTPYVMFDPELPPYASPQLAEARRDWLVTTVNRWCHRCDAVAAVPPHTAMTSEATTRATTRVMHESWCVCTSESLDQLELECSPFGTLERPDASEEAVTAMANWIADFRERRMADLAGQD